eukprot:jgi/Botrbrau1/23655/Bobra.55_2s0038.1
MRRLKGEHYENIQFVCHDLPCPSERSFLVEEPISRTYSGGSGRKAHVGVGLKSRSKCAERKLLTPIFEISETCSAVDRPGVGQLLLRRPIAVLALIPKPAVLFTAGAVAGAIGKTLTAPLDRVKLLLQTGGGLELGTVREASRGGHLLQAFMAVGKEGGLGAYWKGNLPQVLRVLPYSAVQLYSYEIFKKMFRKDDGSLSVAKRLTAGACAGMAATLATYPLDTMRLRLAVDPKVISLGGAAAVLMREGSYGAFFRGLSASLIGIAPYMALELAVFDLIPRDFLPFARGFAAALVATSCCYPLDTVRRQLQLRSGERMPMLATARDMARKGGVLAFYRGFIPNCLKNLPNKGVKLATFDAAKVMQEAAEAAYKEELLSHRKKLRCLRA